MAYEPCETPNEVHGPPLAFASCKPPKAVSDYLTVGTADSNGQPTKFIGSVKYTTLVGNPTTPENEADVRVEASLTDVRCKSAQVSPCSQVALADYTGELQAAAELRITDKDNDFTRVPATIANDFLRVPVPIPCTATADPTVGATCGVDTTLDAVLPGVVKEGMRAIWESREVKVLDGGEDGLAETDDNTVFAKQGIFVP